MCQQSLMLRRQEFVELSNQETVRVYTILYMKLHIYIYIYREYSRKYTNFYIHILKMCVYLYIYLCDHTCVVLKVELSFDLRAQGFGAASKRWN